MEVWNGQIIDIGLTVTGYLAAAGLGMVIHSAWAGRRRRAVAAVATRETNQERPVSIAEPQYIDLRSSRTVRTEGNSAPSARSAGRAGRRDRVEIIRMARQMLEAGAPADRVRRTLPISDAELALLQSVNGN